MLTNEQLKAIMPHAPKAKREASLPILNDVAKAYDISNERRMAAWLATLAVESGELKYQEEIASGSAYEGRKDLGNTQAGDGRRFKGHGRIQITGRFNHQAYTTYLKKSGHLPFIDFITEPKKLAQEPYATDSAGWFFAAKIKANSLADAGDFLRIQIKVNGRNKRTGLPNHWVERNAYWVKGLSVLPNDFNLTNLAAAPATQSQPNGTEKGSDAVEQRSEKSEDNPATDPPPINQPTQAEGQTIVDVPQADPAVAKEPGLIDKARAWMAALPAFVTAGAAGVWSWIQGAATEIIIAFFAAAAVIATVWIVTNTLSRNKREARENELKLQREQHAFELTMFQARSASDRALQTIRIVPSTIANSDDKKTEVSG